MSGSTINPIRQAWEAGKKNPKPQKTAKSSAVKKPKKIELKLRDANKDYQKMLELMLKTNSTAIMTNIKDLINMPPLDFSWLNYNQEKEADKADNYARITGPLKVLGFGAGGAVGGWSVGGFAEMLYGTFTNSEIESPMVAKKVIPAFAIIGMVIGLDAHINDYKNDITEVYSKYTEPQKELLEKLVIYRKIIKLIDPKAKYILLKDFENFVKYVNSLKK